MKKIYAVFIFAIIANVFIGCSDSTNSPTETKVKKSTLMPDFILPLATGNKWDYKVISNNFDTTKITLSIRNSNIYKWEDKSLGYDNNLKSFEMVSSKYSINDVLYLDTIYVLPSILNNGTINLYLAKDKENLITGTLDTKTNTVDYFTALSKTEMDIYIKDKELYNKKIGNYTYDKIHVFRYYKDDSELYYFVDGVGMVYAKEYNKEWLLENYSVK